MTSLLCSLYSFLSSSSSLVTLFHGICLGKEIDVKGGGEKERKKEKGKEKEKEKRKVK